MLITEEDYKIIIGDAALKVVTQTDPMVRENAEMVAQQEIAAYLRPKYDTEAIFAAETMHRDAIIVTYVCDIALYHMIAAMPQKMGSEIRKERYERAIKWLEGVQAGKIIPDLPIKTDQRGYPENQGITFSSQPKLRHNW